MKHKKTWDDSIYENLLEKYRRPSLNADGLAGLNSSLRAKPLRGEGLGGRRTGMLRFASPAGKGIGIAAGVLLFAGIGFFSAVWQSGIPAPYRLAGTESGVTAGTRGALLSSGETTLAFLTDNESVTLAPATKLKISGDPLRRLTGNNANRYRLESGSVRIEHVKGAPAFTLETEWGTVRPLGTVLECALIADGLELTCLEDSLSFTTKQNAVYILTSGSILRLSERGKTITVSPLENAPGESPASPVQNAAAPETAGSAAAGFSPAVPLWTVPLSSAPQKMHVLPGATVLVYPDRLVSLRPADGAVIASLSVPPPIELSAVSDPLVITYGSGLLAAYRLPGLEKAWTAETGTVAFTSFTVSSGRIYVPSADGSLYIHDAGSGALIRKITVGTGLYGKPLVAGGAVYFSTLDRRFVAADSGDGHILWEYRSAHRFVDDSPVAVGTTLVTYTDDGVFTALDKQDGSLLWTASYAGKMGVQPAVWNDRIVFADGDGLKVLSVGGSVRSLKAGPVFDIRASGEKLYFADRDGVSVIDVGTFPDAAALVGGKFISAEIGNGSVLAVLEGNLLSCYSLEN